MSSNTARLGLKRPDGSDPFLRSDFVDNYNKLDATPGYYPCLSTSRPAWGAAQTGMLIVETDTGRVLRWTGSAWATTNDYGQAYTGAANPSVWQSNISTTGYTVAASIPIVRTCWMMIFLTARFFIAGNARQYGDLGVMVDNADATVGGFTTWFMPNAGDSSTNQTVHPSVVGQRLVGPGNHSVQAYSHIGNLGPDVHVTSIKALIVLSE